MNVFVPNVAPSDVDNIALGLSLKSNALMNLELKSSKTRILQRNFSLGESTVCNSRSKNKSRGPDRAASFLLSVAFR
jgi:hypothetical protein